MTKRVQFIRHVKSAADLFLGFIGELTVNTTDNVLRVHDGATVGGIEQARKDLDNVSAATTSIDGKMTAAQATEVAQATTDIATINADHIGVGGVTQHPDAVAAGASGFITGADQTKLDGIETAAKDDLSAAEILALLLTVDGAGSALDADFLDGLNSAAAATVSTIMARDSAGRSKVVDGAVAGDIATKGQMDTADDLRALKTTTITPAAASGLAGGGDLSANRTLNLDINSLAADTVVSGDLVPIEDISGGDDKKVTAQSISDLSLAKFTVEFESTPQTVAINNLLNVAHGLGARPKIYSIVLRCVIADLGYSIDDEVQVNFSGGAANESVTFSADATNLTVIAGSIIGVHNQSSFAVPGTVNPTNWRWIMRGWL